MYCTNQKERSTHARTIKKNGERAFACNASVHSYYLHIYGEASAAWWLWWYFSAVKISIHFTSFALEMCGCFWRNIEWRMCLSVYLCASNNKRAKTHFRLYIDIKRHDWWDAERALLALATKSSDLFSHSATFLQTPHSPIAFDTLYMHNNNNFYLKRRSRCDAYTCPTLTVLWTIIIICRVYFGGAWHILLLLLPPSSSSPLPLPHHSFSLNWRICMQE